MTTLKYPADIVVAGNPFTLGDFILAMVMNDATFNVNWASVNAGRTIQVAVEAGRESRTVELDDVHYNVLRAACEKPRCGIGGAEGYPIMPAMLLHGFLEVIVASAER